METAVERRLRPTAAQRPYPPSWVDRLTAWVERLPLPWWLFYVLLAGVLSGLVALGLWRAGVDTTVGFHPMQVWLPSLAAYLLGLTHALDRAAASAMRRFRPAFRGGDEEFAAAVYRLTTLPARPTLIITAVCTLITIPVGRYEMSMIQTGGLELAPTVFLGVLALLYLLSYPFFYHIIRQLREIHRLHRDWAAVRLSNVRPMYALSRVTSLAAIGVVLNNYGWFLAQPGPDVRNPVMIYEGLFSLSVVLPVFIWPLWSAHRLLAEAKERGLARVAGRKEAARRQLHEAVDAGRLDQVDPLNKVLGALETENAELHKVPTWPWAPGTLRGLLGTVLLPIVLWLIQRLLGSLLG
jgi:hypothetical protein